MAVQPLALADAQAALFDLDGVLTPTATLHMQAWNEMFTELFAEQGIEPAYTDADYFAHLDGKKRYEGVATLLASRGVEKPYGTPEDASDADTVCGIGNRKNAVFTRVVESGHIDPYPGSLVLLNEFAERGIPAVVVSSSKNARAVLQAAGIAERFMGVVDGMVAEREGLASKPAPDMFLAGAAIAEVAPERCVAFEDALSGVGAAAAAGCGLVVGVDRGAGEAALREAGAHVVVNELDELER